jgi:hypothetical protein
MTSLRTRTLLQYDPNVSDYAGCALVVRNDVIEYRTQFLQIELTRCEESLCRLGVGQDSGQGLVEIVNQRARTLVAAHTLLQEQAHTASAASPLRDERG